MLRPLAGQLADAYRVASGDERAGAPGAAAAAGVSGGESAQAATEGMATAAVGQPGTQHREGDDDDQLSALERLERGKLGGGWWPASVRRRMYTYSRAMAIKMGDGNGGAR
jgi:hypothetical protein